MALVVITIAKNVTHLLLTLPLQHDVELRWVFVGERGPEIAANVRKCNRHAAVEKRQGHHGCQQPPGGVVLLPRSEHQQQKQRQR